MPEEKNAYCSSCFTHSRHEIYREPLIGRKIFRCRSCGDLSVLCRYCDNMAAGPLNPDQRDRAAEKFWARQAGDWHDELCAEHNGRVASFSGLTLTLREIEDYEQLFVRRRHNLLRVGKITSGVATAALLVTPAAFLAAPHIAASLGAAGLLGTTAAGTSISALSGAALGSASLAAVGGGTMAGGVLVITAAGASLGGALGGVVSNAYYGQVRDFAVRKQNEGRGPSIVCVDGFLTQKMDDPREWKRGLRTHYRGRNWYHVNWENKTRRELGTLLCRDATGEAARRFGASLAKRALKKAGSKLNPLFWAATAADLVGNPWHVAMHKAAMTGVLLADILARTRRREFTLIGHSLGARVIYYTLLALGTKRRAKPLIRDVYLMGGAVGAGSEQNWDSAATAVSGNIYNCYSGNDQVLKCLYRSATAFLSRPVGAYPIQLRNPKIIDSDFSDLIPGHTAWKGFLAEVLSRITEARGKENNAS